MPLFQDRREAATELSRMLMYLKPEKPIVLGLVYGGVPMAEWIARELEAPLDVLLIERLRAPQNPDHVVGAVDEHGRISMIRSTARWHHLTSQQMVDPAREVFRDLQRLRGKVRAVLPEIEVRDRTVIIVGQGVASGAKMLGAIASVRDRGARKVVAAAPAGHGEAAWQLHEAADQVVIPHRPAKFRSVREFYGDFTEITDDLVMAIVENWVKARPQQAPGVKTLVMKVDNGSGKLVCAEIDLPPGTTRGSGPFPTVLFAHGFESDGRSPRTVPISKRLAKRGIIGVRVDFTGHGRSEGDLQQATPERMAADLRIIVQNVCVLDEVDEGRMGLVGSGSGSTLVLDLARAEPAFRAVVARGPLAGTEVAATMHVPAPTLLLYAEQDEAIGTTERELAKRLPSIHQTVEIPDATRLFNDAISMEMMVGASVDWLVDHLAPIPVSGGEEVVVAEPAAEESAAPAEGTT